MCYFSNCINSNKVTKSQWIFWTITYVCLKETFLELKKKLLWKFEYIEITCMFWSRKYNLWQYKANEMVGFERMILARLMSYIMSVSILVTIHYLLHVTSICTTKVPQWKNYRCKWYIANLCLRHDHETKLAFGSHKQDILFCFEFACFSFYHLQSWRRILFCCHVVPWNCAEMHSKLD